MQRRTFLKSLAAGTAGGLFAAPLPKAKITRVRTYQPPNLNRTINQSNMLVAVETDIGITGIGEGGTKDLLEQCAGSLVGKNPFQIERVWQHMYIDWFYPPGREKVHALGAMDMALWDIKGKAFQAPVHQLLGGMARTHVECYGVPRTGAGGVGFVTEGTRTDSSGPARLRLPLQVLRQRQDHRSK
jgi:L-alanine-DL-glutamate epimerase-like enolase superfamily enzyme